MVGVPEEQESMDGVKCHIPKHPYCLLKIPQCSSIKGLMVSIRRYFGHFRGLLEGAVTIYPKYKNAMRSLLARILPAHADDLRK